MDCSAAPSLARRWGDSEAPGDRIGIAGTPARGERAPREERLGTRCIAQRLRDRAGRLWIARGQLGLDDERPRLEGLAIREVRERELLGAARIAARPQIEPRGVVGE